MVEELFRFDTPNYYRSIWIIFSRGTSPGAYKIYIDPDPSTVVDSGIVDLPEGLIIIGCISIRMTEEQR